MFIILCLNLTCKYDMILQNGRFAKNIGKNFKTQGTKSDFERLYTVYG